MGKLRALPFSPRTVILVEGTVVGSLEVLSGGGGAVDNASPSFAVWEGLGSGLGLPAPPLARLWCGHSAWSRLGLEMWLSEVGVEGVHRRSAYPRSCGLARVTLPPSRIFSQGPALQPSQAPAVLQLFPQQEAACCPPNAPCARSPSCHQPHQYGAQGGLPSGDCFCWLCSCAQIAETWKRAL